MAGNPYAGISENAFISNLFASRINEKLRRQQQEQQAEELARQVAQQRFVNKMAQEEARQRQEGMRLQGQGQFGNILGDINKMNPEQAATFRPMLSGIAGQSGVPFDANIQLGTDATMKLTAADVARMTDNMKYLTPEAQSQAWPIVQWAAQQAGFENIPVPTSPMQRSASPLEQSRIADSFYNQSKNFDTEGMKTLAPAYSTAAIQGGMNLPGGQFPVPVTPSLPERGMEVKESEQQRKGAQTFIGWLKDGTWNTIPPEQRGGILKEIMPNASDEQISKWSAMTQGLTEAQKAVIERLAIQTKSLDNAMARYEGSRQIALARLADMQKRTNIAQQRANQASSGGSSGRLNPGSLLTAAAGLSTQAIALRNYPAKMEKNGTPLSATEIENINTQADQLEAQASALQNMAPAAAQQGYNLTLNLPAGALPAPGFSPPGSGNTQDMSYGAVAKRWSYKNGRRVVSDSSIQKLVSGTKTAKSLIKSGKLSASDYGKAFRADAKRYGYTSTEANRLFKIFMTQL
jgi:hypothetical protein